jgi:hypothetical protein
MMISEKRAGISTRVRSHFQQVRLLRCGERVLQPVQCQPEKDLARSRIVRLCGGLQAVHGPVPAQFDMRGPLFSRTGAFHRVVFADASRSRHGKLTPERMKPDAPHRV